MIKKPSVLSRIRITSPLIESLKSDLTKERLSFIESLTSNQMANALPPNVNLGTLKNGTPITRDAVSNQANAVPIAQTENGTKIITDPKTGKLIIVAANPEDVITQTPEDAAKMQELIQLSQQTGVAQANQPTPQQATQATNVAQQKAAQQKATQRVNENEDTLKSFVDDLKMLFSTGPKYDHSGHYTPDEVDEPKKEEPVEEYDLTEEDETTDSGGGQGLDIGTEAPPEEPEKHDETVEDKPEEEVVETEDESSFDHLTKNDGLVQVAHAHDNMIDPNEALNALGDTFWTPPSHNLKSAVTQAQKSIGAPAGPVEIEEPHGLMARRNMSQYVKTGLNSQPGMPGNVIGNDFDDIMGIDSPYAVKLALTIGK